MSICCSEPKGVRVALNIKSDNYTGEVNLTYAVIAFFYALSSPQSSSLQWLSLRRELIYATLTSEVSNRKARCCIFQGSKATFATAMVMAEVIN
ncbi:MAG: hypothetical protein R3Y66_00090 [Rikenellaceae bacterium]